jgi:hypothetical protein
MLPLFQLLISFNILHLERGQIILTVSFKRSEKTRMREFHAKCVKISRIKDWLKNHFFNLRAFTPKIQLALSVLKDFQNNIDGFYYISENARPSNETKQITHTNL